MSWHPLEGPSISLGDRVRLEAHRPQLWHSPRPRLEPPPWAGSWKLGPWAWPASRGRRVHGSCPQPWLGDRGGGDRLPALCLATATAQAPQVHSQLWTRAPRSLACFLAKLPQEAWRATPFPVPRTGREHRGRGLLKQPGPRGQLRASPAPPHLRSHNYKRGRVSPPGSCQGPKASTAGSFLWSRNLPERTAKSSRSPRGLCSLWSRGLFEGWGTEKQEGSLRGRVSADAVHSLPPSQPHSDVQDTRCGWQSARVQLGVHPLQESRGFRTEARKQRQRTALCPRAVTAAGAAPDGASPVVARGPGCPSSSPSLPLSWHQGTDPGFCHTFPICRAGPLRLSPRRPREPGAPPRALCVTPSLPLRSPRASLDA